MSDIDIRYEIKLLKRRLCILEKMANVIVIEDLDFEFVNTFSEISGNTTRFIRVAQDETNNGDKSLYIYSIATGLEFLQTIA